MPKLHEVIAVEGELEGTYKKILEETKGVFQHHSDLFTGFSSRYEPFDEDDLERDAVEKDKHMESTVPEKLAYMFSHVIKYIDCVAQKDATNQKAVADIIVDDITIASDVPSTTLLGLESKLRIWKSVLDTIPTLAAGIEFSEYPDMGENVWKRAKPEQTFRTHKEPKSKVLYEATDKHPAQIEKWTEDVNVGKTVKESWCGVLSSRQKNALLSKLDKLSRAVKQARQRANATDVEKVEIGQALVNYIMS